MASTPRQSSSMHTKSVDIGGDLPDSARTTPQIGPICIHRHNTPQLLYTCNTTHLHVLNTLLTFTQGPKRLGYGMCTWSKAALGIISKRTGCLYSHRIISVQCTIVLMLDKLAIILSINFTLFHRYESTRQ